VTPRLVFGVPLYNGARHLPEALESLLGQLDAEIAIVLVDDGSTDATPEIVARYATADSRVTYLCNETRLGLTRNWRRCFEVARELHPECELFAWASDHDVWHPAFASSLIAALDEVPGAAVAYPNDAVIRERNVVEFRQPSVDTRGVRGTRPLLALLARKMRAGQMVYGVFRVDALRAAGGFRHVLFADRLVLTEVALQGSIVRVSDVLWYKRPTAVFGIERQRRACFPGRVPFHARIPWWLEHAGTLAWSYAARGSGRPAVGRAAGLRVAVLYAWENATAVYSARWRTFLKKRRRRSKERALAERRAVS
jgi:glycosyltransferase involved in cell wall biosynthesis